MIKKSNTVRMLIIMLQAVCLFLVCNLGSSAYADTSSYNDFGITGINSPDSPSFLGDNGSPILTSAGDCVSSCLNKQCSGKLIPKNCRVNKKKYCETICTRLSQKQAVSVVQYLLIPLQFVITYVAYIMGFFFLAWGLSRLRHGHEGGGYNRQHSGVGTVLCFVAATMIFQYQWTTHMLGNSLMGPGSGDSWKYTTSGGADAKLPVDPVNLFGYVSGATHDLRQNTVAMSGFGTAGILQGESWSKFSQDTKDSFMTLETLFAVLMVVGYISFLRGAMLLVKMGEGMGGGESSGTKAVVHIVAAGLLCNANHVTALINNLSGQVNSTN